MIVHRYDDESVFGKGLTLYNVLDDESQQYAKKLFDIQKERGIYKSSFEDDVWILSNGYETKRIDFGKIDKSPMLYSKNNYILLVKKYCVGKVDSRSIVSVAALINNIIKWGNQTLGWTTALTEYVDEREIIRISDFLELIEVDETHIFEGYNLWEHNRDDNTRDLAPDFWTYYVFDYEINEFWETATEEEKIVYGPLYLYWKLCCILPTRPRGFCLMPKACIELDEEGFYKIIVRQSHIKGNGKDVTNVVKRDYPIRSYRIDSKLATEFLAYRERISDSYNEFEDDYLFNNVMFNRLRKGKLDKMFRREHLANLKELFVIEVLEKKGYRVKEFKAEEVVSYTLEKWITPWCLSELRHLAMIDMIIRGVSPAVIIELAGQESLASACHYYNNSANMARSRLAFLEWRYSGRNTQIKTNFLSEAVKSNFRLPVYGGDCTNEQPLEVKKVICSKYGNCADGCEYFVPNNEAKLLYEKALENKLKKRVEEFIYWFDSGKKNKAIEAIENMQNEIVKITRGYNGEEKKIY